MLYASLPAPEPRGAKNHVADGAERGKGVGRAEEALGKAYTRRLIRFSRLSVGRPAGPAKLTSCNRRLPPEVRALGAARDWAGHGPTPLLLAADVLIVEAGLLVTQIHLHAFDVDVLDLGLDLFFDVSFDLVLEVFLPPRSGENHL